MLTIKYETTFKKDFKRVLRQHRTKTALRRSATALHKFRQPISVRLWLRFLGRHLICLHIFRHLAQKSLDIRQYAFGISVQSDEKSDSASAALSLCGIALRHSRNTEKRKQKRFEKTSKTCRFCKEVAKVGLIYLRHNRNTKHRRKKDLKKLQKPAGFAKKLQRSV